MRGYNDDESMKRSKRCFKSLSSLKLSFFFLFSFLSIIFDHFPVDFPDGILFSIPIYF